MNIILDSKLIKRTSKKYIQSLLSKHSQWKVLDIGCGYSANEFADTICDVQDLSQFYKDKNFIRLKDKKLPFIDNQFDFVIASHVLEHVEDPKFFITEIERVSKKGYIELPTKLEDNLVFENKKDHLWHMDFNDVDSKLIISNKLQLIEPILTVSSAHKLRKNFKSSFVLELYWENKIDYDYKNEKESYEKFSLLTLFRKFFSKKIRSIFS